jgi:hypothetical protein
MRPSVPFRILLVTVVLGAALVAGILAGGRLGTPPAAAPHLRTTSPDELRAMGLRLTAVAQPPHCPAVQSVFDHLTAGVAGCPISATAAEAVVRRDAGRGRAVESVLARVSSTNPSDHLRERPAWVVVVSGGAVVMPAPPICLRQPCVGPPPPPEIPEDLVAVVDAYAGTVLVTRTARLVL